MLDMPTEKFCPKIFWPVLTNKQKLVFSVSINPVLLELKANTEGISQKQANHHAVEAGQLVIDLLLVLTFC